MTRIEFTEEEIEKLRYQSFHHPPEFPKTLR